MKYKNRLFELRGNLSQKEFAERIGLSQQNYANYENGKQGLKYAKAEKETPGQSAVLKNGWRSAPTLNPKVEGSSPSWCTTETPGQRLIVAGLFTA